MEGCWNEQKFFLFFPFTVFGFFFFVSSFEVLITKTRRIRYRESLTEPNSKKKQIQLCLNFTTIL